MFCSNARAKDPFPNGHPKSGTVVVYGRPTTRVEKVMYILEELNVPYERVHFISPPPDYFEDINPAKLVPAIRDGQVVMDGSNSICAYLAHKYGQHLGIFPSNSLLVGKAIQWSEFVEGYLATPRLNHVFHAVVNKAYPPSLAKKGCPTDEEIEKSITATVDAMRILDSHIKNQMVLSNSRGIFVADSNTFTFADAAAAPWVHKWYSHADDFDPRLSRSKFGAVTQYYDLLSERPAFARGILYRKK
jgi:glutathione S-transferase